MKLNDWLNIYLRVFERSVNVWENLPTCIEKSARESLERSYRQYACGELSVREFLGRIDDNYKIVADYRCAIRAAAAKRRNYGYPEDSDELKSAYISTYEKGLPLSVDKLKRLRRKIYRDIQRQDGEEFAWQRRQINALRNLIKRKETHLGNGSGSVMGG